VNALPIVLAFGAMDAAGMLAGAKGCSVRAGRLVAGRGSCPAGIVPAWMSRRWGARA
jgi:hypothetical protein